MKDNNSSIFTSHPGNCINCWIHNFYTSGNCNSEIRSRVLFNTQTKKYNKGEYLFYSGNTTAEIFCIKNGMVKIFQKGKKNQEYTLWLAGAGDIIGLHTLINHEPISFSASAIAEVTACSIPATDVKIILKNDLAASAQIMKNVCSKLDFIEQRITSISGKKINEQCAELLVYIATHENDGNMNSCISYSVKDLASLIGTTKNYLYKILLEFVNKKILSVKKREIFIHNMNALSAIATGKNAIHTRL